MAGYAFNTGGNSPLMLDPMAEMQQASAQAKQSKLVKLLGTAANAGAGADYSQANMIDPAATQAFQKNQSGLQDDRFKSFAQKASMAAAAWKAGNQSLAQGIYASLVPEAHAIAPGFDLPPQMDDSAAEAFSQLPGAGGDEMKSLRIGANGNYWAIRGGQFVDTGTKADPRTQLRDQPGLQPGLVDMRTGQINPLQDGTQQQPPQAQQPPPMQATGPKDDAAIIAQANQMAQAGMPTAQVDAWVRQQQSAPVVLGGGGGGPMQPPQQSGPAAPRPLTTPAQEQAMRLAQEASQRAAEAGQRDQQRLALQQAAAAQKGAPAAPDSMKAQKIAAARADALDSVTQAISGIDTLTKSGGFGELGTYTGDVLGMIPHTQTKDAQNALETVKNQVLLTTLSKLKALSATGASGFGALSNQEGNILKNSIANLETAQSHGAIVHNLNIIRSTLQRAAGLIGGQQSTPQHAHVDDLLSKYGVK